jgi:hypothetical protein
MIANEKAPTWRGRYHGGAGTMPGQCLFRKRVALRNRFKITCESAIATIAYDGRLIRSGPVVSVIGLPSLWPAAPPLFVHRASRVAHVDS